MSPRQPARLFAMVFAGAAASLVIPFIIGVIKLAANLDYYDDNAWVMYGFFRYHDPALFPSDYAAGYYLSMWMPPAFKGLQYLFAQFADPLLLHRALAPVLWLGCAPLVFFTARRLGGRANAWATLAIYLTSSVFLNRMSAGLPHSFAPAFMWWAVAALVSGRPLSLALCTIISAGFYPIVTPIAGLMLAISLLFPQLAPTIPQRSAVSNWPRKGKLAFLIVAGGLTLLAVAPIALSQLSTDYGRVMNQAADHDAYPETTHFPSPPALTMLLLMYYQEHSARLGTAGSVILMLLGFGILVAGQGLRDMRDRRPSSLTPFVLSAGIICVAANFFDYANVYRYVAYTVPVWITLSLPLSLRRISRRAFPWGGKAPAFALMLLVYISCVAKVTPEATGYPYKLNDGQKHAAEFISTLPKDTLLAGWPGDDSGKIIEITPYTARRQVLVTWETHAKIHLHYVEAMRERMNAIIDAYLARDNAPLISLRDRFHVDYLVVNEADLQGARPPKYFKPFDERAHQLWEEGKGKNFVIPELAKTIGVYSRDGIDILDLHKL